MADTIVLFGGTFDPVHHGHLIAARAVAEHRGFSRITFVPSARPPHKDAACAAAADRLAMLHLATSDEAMFDVCDLELQRSGPSYTFDTLTALRARAGEDVELHLLVGADTLADLPNWHRAAEVVQLAGVVVAARPPWDRRMEGILAALRQRLGPGVVERIAEGIVATPLIDISSSDIRRRVAAGRSIRFLVPEAVRQYIEGHGLYAARGGGRLPTA